MKILYKNLPFKTNRNGIAGLGAGVNAPNNLNNKLRSVNIKTLKLPKFVYHISRTPISQFTPNRIFYVSFDKKQALLHMKQYLVEGLNKYPKIYLYTLKPKRTEIKAIIFDEKHRPKTISNTIGLKYNKYTRSAMSKLMLEKKLTVNNISSENFKEGSGDNMILGHLLCSRTGTNGIRNSFNQDELAVCNPVDFFTIYNKEVLDISGRTEPIPPKPKQSFLNKLLGKKPIIKNKSTGSFFSIVPRIVPRGSLPPGNAINIRRNGSIVFSRNAHKPMGYVSNINVLKLLQRYGISRIQEARAKQALSKLTKTKTGWKNLFSFRFRK